MDKKATKWYMGMDRVYGTNSCCTDSKKYIRDDLEEVYPEALKALEGAVSRPVKLAGG